jgi:hypothetical protein
MSMLRKGMERSITGNATPNFTGFLDFVILRSE